jgi:transposase-like protein
MAFPDNRFAMIKRICPHCGAVDANVNEWKERKYKNKKDITIIYYLQGYICNKCEKWFLTPVNFDLNKEMKEKMGLDKKILEIHANTGLSFDKIAEILEITMNVNVSHEYVRTIIQQEHGDFIYETEIIPLPSDFKKKGKTSKERKVTDIGTLIMFKKKNMEISGEIEVDELFTNIKGRRYYLVNVFANEIRDMPIAVAIVNSRHYDVMKKFFDFIFENSDFKALTSDMLGVYKKITENEEVPQQKCMFHWMKYNGKKIFDEIKKEKIPEKDKTWYLMLYTEMKEIIRSFDKKTTEQLILKFKDHLSNIPDFMKKIVNKFFKDLESLIKYSEIDKMVRTTSKAENFNSLPQIRHKKRTSKKQYPLLLSMCSMVKHYKANYRTLKYRT